MRSLFHVCIAALILTGCGSDGPSFGEPMDPTPIEQSTISSSAHDLALIANANLQGKEAAAAALSFALTAQVLIGPGTARAVPDMPDLAQLVPSLGAPAALLFDQCAVVGPNSVVWSHCQSDGFTIDGTISWTQGHVDVDLHVAGASSGVTLTYSLTGGISVSSTSIDGDMTVSYSYSGNGVSGSQSIRSQIDVQIANRCITGGTLTVTASGSGTGARNAAIQVVWTACNMFRVRHA